MIGEYEENANSTFAWKIEIEYICLHDLGEYEEDAATSANGL